jgi:hypothetical protein
MINEYGELDGMRIAGENQSTWKKTSPSGTLSAIKTR